MIDAALAYAAAGWPTFPLRPGEKVPATRRGFHDATTETKQIMRWWGSTPEANIGIDTGAAGLVVVDLDVKNGCNGWTSWLALCDQHGGEPETYETETPTGGGHLYFAAGGREVRNSAGKLGDGIDIRAAGGYVVAPPSRTDAGRYELIAHRPLAPVPGWLVELLAPPKRRRPVERRSVGWTDPRASSWGQAALDGELEKVANAPEGQRHDTVARAAFKLGQRVAGEQITRSDAEPALVQAACMSGLPDREAERTVVDCLEAGLAYPVKPGELPLDDHEVELRQAIDALRGAA